MGLAADVILRKPIGFDSADRQTEIDRPMKDSNWGLAGSLFRGVVIPEPPSEREVAAEGRRKEPCGTNDSGEENNIIFGNSEIISSKFASLRGLPQSASLPAPSRREPLDACNHRGMGFALCLCKTKAKLAINKQ